MAGLRLEVDSPATIKSKANTNGLKIPAEHCGLFLKAGLRIYLGWTEFQLTGFGAGRLIAVSLKQWEVTVAKDAAAKMTLNSVGYT